MIKFTIVLRRNPKMTHKEWSDIYRTAWDAYYSKDHLATILRRGMASGSGMARLVTLLFLFSHCVAVEDVHPLQGGLFRIKDRRGRRPGMPIEPIWAFYPNYLWETVSKNVRHAKHWLWLELLRRRIKREQRFAPYMDQALMPVADGEAETLEIFTHNEGAREAVVHQRKVAALTRHTPAPTAQH